MSDRELHKIVYCTVNEEECSLSGTSYHLQKLRLVTSQSILCVCYSSTPGQIKSPTARVIAQSNKRKYTYLILHSSLQLDRSLQLLHHHALAV